VHGNTQEKRDGEYKEDWGLETCGWWGGLEDIYWAHLQHGQARAGGGGGGEAALTCTLDSFTGSKENVCVVHPPTTQTHSTSMRWECVCVWERNVLSFTLLI